MAGKGVIMATQEELRRLHMIEKVLEGGLKQVEAAEILSLSSRQIRRMVRRVKKEGQRGIVHRSRGQPSNRKLADQLREKVIKLYKENYKGFGPTLACEKLLEREGVSLSDETLRIWVLESGDWRRTRKRRKHRQWRERKGHPGEMVQMDGSHHAWFEDRGEPCVLMGYIDDARGNAFGMFHDHEGTMPAMDSFKRYIRKYGLPLKVYLDGHSTYKSTAKPTIEEQLEGVEPLSEFERALKELEVEVSHAHTPQAKGRIERLFRTFQDRVIKEMRLKGVRTIEEGNRFLSEYLPIYNKRFSVRPREEEDLHRPLPRGLDLNAILCIKTERTLRNDFTVAHNRKLYQIEEATKASKVIVQDRMDGSMRITHQGKALKFREITERPIKENKQPVIRRKRRSYIPPVDHPWRRFKIKNHAYGKERFLESQI